MWCWVPSSCCSHSGESRERNRKRINELCKSNLTIGEIDKVLAKHYGFTPEELDFIINYDIKYRTGKELEEVK